MTYSNEWYEKNKESILAAKKRYYHRTKKLRGPNKKKLPKPYERQMLSHAKTRAKAKGIEFSLSLEHIVIPSTCPVLGISIFTGGGRLSPNSPSLDRVDNTKGYVPENIRVISNRANILKKDGTLNELKAIVKYMEEHEG